MCIHTKLPFHAADTRFFVWLDVLVWDREIVTTTLFLWHTESCLINVLSILATTVVDNLWFTVGVQVVLAVGITELDRSLVTDRGSCTRQEKNKKNA